MNFEERTPKEGDQEQANKILRAFSDLIEKNPQWEGNLISSSFMSAVADVYSQSGVPYEIYKEDMLSMTEFYKNRWKKNSEGV